MSRLSKIVAQVPVVALHVLIAALLGGCEEDGKTNGFETVVLSGDVCPDCSRITISYPQLVEESPLQLAVERSISEEIIEALTLQESGQASTITEAMESFQRQNSQMNRRFRDESAQWIAEIEGRVTHRSSRLIGLHLSFLINTGGAHGNIYDHLLIFDVERGREVEIGEVIRLSPEFLEVAERYFRNDQDLDAGQSLMDAGFLFLNNQFELPETMGLGTKGVVLLYQQGEISSAMDDPVVAVIPYSAASPFLKDSYKGAF